LTGQPIIPAPVEGGSLASVPWDAPDVSTGAMLLEPIRETFHLDALHGDVRVLDFEKPCTFDYSKPHPVSTVDGRRIGKFKRNLEAFIEYWRARGWNVSYSVLAMRYDKRTGELAVKGDRVLHYGVQRFLQGVERRCMVQGHRKGERRLKREARGHFCEHLKVEYVCVMEPTEEGVYNHANLVIASNGPLPSDSVLSDIWAHSTYGTSYNVSTSIVKREKQAGLASYLAKNLGNYLSKTMQEGEEEGRVEQGGEETGAEGAAWKSDRIATRKRVSNYVSHSRGWLPYGAQEEWKRLFVQEAYFWRCDRGFYHTEMGQTMPKWLGWLRRQGMGAA